MTNNTKPNITKLETEWIAGECSRTGCNEPAEPFWGALCDKHDEEMVKALNNGIYVPAYFPNASLERKPKPQEEEG